MGFWSRLLGKNRATLISSTVEVVQKDSHSFFDLFAGGIAPVVPQSTSFEVASLHFRTIFIKNNKSSRLGWKPDFPAGGAGRC
ncbi:hypothetical protein ASE26_14805 [Duganella sp. Root198D2]|nr:hypothetical protein ASE26_14805 [Duganella sp. Root198D2]